MSRDKPRAAPATRTARHDQHPDESTESRSTVAQGVAPVADLAAYRELRSWVAAAEWLNGLGYAAAVPASVVVPLRRRGLAVWVAGQREAAG
jgi:hypothetical protein